MPKKMKYMYHINGTIPYPAKGWVFVFGSNLAGLHKLGAADVAYKLFEATMFNGAGYMGRSYAIPTKDRFIRTLNRRDIQKYINGFIEFTHSHPELNFWVTAVGCGLAKYHDRDIAPLFKGCNTNCSFPINWRKYMEPPKLKPGVFEYNDN